MIEYDLQYLIPIVLGVKVLFTLFPHPDLSMITSSGGIV